jgi:hypothetical protein
MLQRITILSILCFLRITVYAQEPSKAAVNDSVFKIYWDTTIQISVHIFNPQEEDDRNNNAVLIQTKSGNGGTKILFKDSIFIAALLYKVADMDGDGQKDLLVYNNSASKSNQSYHLYLVDQKTGMLLKVRRFERVLNPVFNWKKCMIQGFELYDKKIVLNTYGVDKKGTLFIVRGGL